MLHHNVNGLPCPLCAEKLSQVDLTLQLAFSALVAEWPHMHVSWGFRGEQDQNTAFESGKSTKRWPESSHNKTPALAIDLFEIDPQNGNGLWHLSRMREIAAFLKKRCPAIKWSGDWKEFKEFDHFYVDENP